MIERILEQRLVVCAVLTENRSNRTLILTPDEFTILEELASVLNAIKKATDLLSGSKYASFLYVSSATAAVAQFPQNEGRGSPCVTKH